MKQPTFRVRFFAVFALLAGCTQTEVQSQRHFDQAIDDVSTSYPVVKIEFVDLRTNKVERQCVFAGMLREAVRLERKFPKNFDGPDPVNQLIKQQPRHRFEFRDPQAIEMLQRMRSGFDMRKACEIIDSGRPAMIGDYAPYLYAGNAEGSGWTQVK